MRLLFGRSFSDDFTINLLVLLLAQMLDFFIYQTQNWHEYMVLHYIFSPFQIFIVLLYSKYKFLKLRHTSLFIYSNTFTDKLNKLNSRRNNNMFYFSYLIEFFFSIEKSLVKNMNLSQFANGNLKMMFYSEYYEHLLEVNVLVLMFISIFSILTTRASSVNKNKKRAQLAARTKKQIWRVSSK